MEMTTNKLHYAWKVFISLCVITFVIGMGSSYSIFMTPCTAEFGCSTTAFGLVYTLQSYAQVVGTPIFAAIYRKLDSRLATILAVGVCGLCYIAQGFAQSVTALYVINVFLGLTQGFLVLVLGADIIGRWFAKNIATLVGLAGCLRAAGGAVFNALGGWLIDVADWRWATIIFGICCLVILPVCLWCRKEPAQLGLKPYGVESLSDEDSAAAGKLSGLTFKRLRRMPAFWVLTICIMVTPFCNVLYGYLNDWLQTTKGLTSTAAGLCNSALMVGGILGYITVGRICDKNIRGGIIACLAGAVIAYPILSWTNGLGYAAFLVLFFLIGLTYQPSCGSMEPAIVRTAIGMKDYTQTWTFLVSALNFLGATGSVAWGLCIGWFGHAATFTICAVVYALLGVVYLIVMNISKNKWMKMPEWAPEAR